MCARVVVDGWAMTLAPAHNHQIEFAIAGVDQISGISTNEKSTFSY